LISIFFSIPIKSLSKLTDGPQQPLASLGMQAVAQQGGVLSSCSKVYAFKSAFASTMSIEENPAWWKCHQHTLIMCGLMSYLLHHLDVLMHLHRASYTSHVGHDWALELRRKFLLEAEIWYRKSSSGLQHTKDFVEDLAVWLAAHIPLYLLPFVCRYSGWWHSCLSRNRPCLLQ